MSDPQQTPWPDNPNAPQISYYLYFEEKAYISGTFISSILYGTLKLPTHTCPYVRAHLFCSVYSRDDHYAVLQMYGCPV